jgi:tetratricopeptide (TPR) repeat protein
MRAGKPATFSRQMIRDRYSVIVFRARLRTKRPTLVSGRLRTVVWQQVVPLLLSVMLGMPVLAPDARGQDTGLQAAEEAVRTSEQERGPEHPDTAVQLNRLAILYREAGQFTKALPLFERALAIREKTLGPDDPAMAESIKGLATVYLKLGQPAKALPLYERALSVTEALSNPKQEDLVEALNGLASALNDLGQYAKALPLYDRRARGRRAARGDDGAGRGRARLG